MKIVRNTNRSADDFGRLIASIILVGFFGMIILTLAFPVFMLPILQTIFIFLITVVGLAVLAALLFPIFSYFFKIE